MAKEINLNEVEPNSAVLVKGKMGFNHIPFYEGEALKQKIQQDISRNSKYPMTDPHDEITVYDASIQCATPGQPNMAEKYVAQLFYDSKSENYTGKCITWRQRKYNASTKAPWVGEAREGGKVVQINPTGTLASGLDVTLVFSTFKAKKGNGMRLVGIICNEPVQYFGSNVNDLLASRGITFEACETDDDTAVEETVETEVPFTDAPAGNPFDFDADDDETPEAAPGVSYDTSLFN